MDNGRLHFDSADLTEHFLHLDQTIKRCIGYMKRQFRRIREIPLEMLQTIISACILSNMCVLKDADIDQFVIPDQDKHTNLYQNIGNNRQDGFRRRVQPMNNLQ